MKYQSLLVPSLIVSVMTVLFTGCVNETPTDNPDVETIPAWVYAGGEQGTSFNSTANCFEQPTPKVEAGDWMTMFKRGEQLFEKQYTSNQTGVRSGLGPVYVRSSCIHCHPGYGHGMSIPAGTYNSMEIGNGTLLVVYDKSDENYVTWVAGMPQLHAVAPFKAPIDEKQITVTWQTATECAASNNVMSFPDGESFELRYPIVNMPVSAIYGADIIAQNNPNINNYGVKLENTIGIFGTGLTDAIPDDSITAQWAREEQAYNKGYLKHFKTAWFSGGAWLPGAYYTNTKQGGDGTPYVRRYTYAMSRGPILDAAGANAIWNIPNVTRSNRTFHYLDLAGTNYATISSQDPEVQAEWPAYIDRLIAADSAYAKYKLDNVEEAIYAYLTAKDLPAEMSDNDYTDFMVWHRGLAVPAVRDYRDEKVLRGKELFTEIGCATCHRPSWKTGPDHIQDPSRFFTRDQEMPRYPNQTIWPYTDFVQHKLCMAEDIRTGWCRTTPLWGRGLHMKATGDVNEARLHDTRARNCVEAIMWHGYSEESDAIDATRRFYNLPKKDRDALVAFLNAI